MRKLLSTVSLWEITIKYQVGKLALGMALPDFFERFVRGADLDLVEIELAHLVAYGALPLHHRDPFDRLLVAQSKTLRAPLVTADPAMAAYDVETVWS